tara:strand:- start:2802 stop:3854 length:1053 start_codon:yes stop_codon:yes gene_type:complete
MINEWVLFFIYQAFPVFAIASIATYLSIPWIEYLSFRINLTVGFEQRRSFFGGAILWVGILVSSFLHTETTNEMIGIGVGLTYACIWGVIEDKYIASRIWRSIGNSLGIFILLSLGIRIDRWQWDFFSVSGDWIAVGVIVSFFIGMGLTSSLYVFKRMNGVLCSYVGIVASTLGVVCFTIHNNLMAILAFSLAGVCFSFYKYNQNPIRLYIGRSGVNVCGYLLYIICIQGVMNKTFSSHIVMVLFLFAIPIGFYLARFKYGWQSFQSKQIPGFSVRNRRLNNHPQVQVVKWGLHLSIMMTGGIIMICLVLNIPLLMVLSLMASAIYGFFVLGILFIPRNWIKRILALFRI